MGTDAYGEIPDEFESWLPDLTNVSLAELMASDDPMLLAAMRRVVAEVLAREPDDGCC